MADATRLTIELEVLLRQFNRRLRELDQIERKLKSIANIRVGQRGSTGPTDRQTTATQRLAAQQQRLQLQQQRLAVQTQELTNRQERARQAAERLARSNDRLTHSAERQSRILPHLQQRLNSVGAAALRVGGGLRSVGASAAILVTGPLAALARIAGGSAADIDAIRNRLIATEGSLEAANARLTELRQLADTTVGVTRRTALDTFAILATLGDVTEDTINQQIKAFGRLNAAFTIEDQQLFFRNLLQIFQQGFEVKDIKEAIGRVPIFNQLLQQAFGTSDPEQLRQLKESGKITLDTFLSGMATAVETNPVLGNIQESIRVRFAKTFERISDSLEPLGLAILGPLERIVLRVEPIILRISEAFGRLPEGMQTAIVAAGILTAALGPILFILGGIASGIGALATAAAAMIPILSAIGLPAIAAILAGLAIVVANITLAVTALGLAWRSNFLNIRGLVSNAANAVLVAFNRIRGVFQEFRQRVLPTLESLTTKVIGVITEAWNRYGSTIVRVVGDAFRFITDVTVTFLKLFTDFVDLVLKLIDGDWRGAWRAFARIIITQLDNIGPLLIRLAKTVERAITGITIFLIRQAFRFADAGLRLASQFTASLAIGLVAGAPQIGNALSVMLVAAALGVAMGPIAQLLVARLVAELRKAAAEGLAGVFPVDDGTPKVGADIGVGRRAGIFRPKGPPAPPGKDDAQSALNRQLDRLREAQDKLAEAQEEGQLAQLRSRIETQFNETKAGLDRESAALEASFDDRLVALKSYIKQRGELQNSQIDAEIVKELELTSVLFSELASRRRGAEREFQTELSEIEQDPKLKGRARDAAIQAAQLTKAASLEKALSEFRIKHEESSARVNELEKDRKASTEALLRLERELTREIEAQKVQLRADLAEEQGRTLDAETIRLKARFTETLRDLRVDVASLPLELQNALNGVDLSILQQRLDELPEPVRTLIELLDIGIKRAAIVEAQTFVDNLSTGLRLDEQRIQNRVLDGLINQRQAQQEILTVQRQYRGVLLDVLAGELARAEAIKDQGLIVAIKEQIVETERLGVAIDEIGQQINQALFSDLQSGISGIFSGARKGFEGLRDAAISFGERLLDMLNDLAATSIVQQLEGIFKPDATDTTGTPGGFLSKLFGLAPEKQADAAAASATLQSGAVGAAASLSTGIATASATFTTSVITAATSFSASIIAAGAALAASVAASSAAQGLGGLGGAIGAAATGLFPSVPGGLVRIVEGGYPEAVLTTDPKHAARQVAILKAFLKETRGLGGRIRGLAAGGFTDRIDISAPQVSLSNIGLGELSIAGGSSTMKLRQVIVDQRDLGNWVNSSEGEQVLVDFLYRKSPVIRKIGGGK